MPEITIHEIMNAMPSVFVPERAGDLSAQIQYRLSGDEASDWIISIAAGGCTVQQGVCPNPQLTVTIAAEDQKALAFGKLDAMAAFMQGKLRLSGDMSLAMKLPSLFKIKS